MAATDDTGDAGPPTTAARPARARTHPAVDPDVADGETTPLPRSSGHPELDGRARTAGQTWIGWRVQLQPGEVAAAGDAGVRRRAVDEDRTSRDEARRRLRRRRPGSGTRS